MSLAITGSFLRDRIQFTSSNIYSLVQNAPLLHARLSDMTTILSAHRVAKCVCNFTDYKKSTLKIVDSSRLLLDATTTSTTYTSFHQGRVLTNCM